ADEYGGGIDCAYWCNSTIEYCTISDNSSELGAGISITHESNPEITNCTISENSATAYGGGIYCYDYSNPILENVMVTNNTAGMPGGGIFCQNSSPSLTNVTITGNSSAIGGAVYCRFDCHPLLINSILWTNSPQEIYFCEEGSTNSITISYSDVQGGEAGIVTNNNGTVNWLEGNIDEDPLFVGIGEHPYSLLGDSPCIDAGIPDTTGLNLPPWDIIGNHRIWDGDGNGSAIIDMGAYEYGAPPFVEINNNVIVQNPVIQLNQNYPNPFNPITTIEFSIQHDSEINISIFNIKGQKIKILTHNEFIKGNHSIIWNGTDDNNKLVSSGVYLYKLNVNGKKEAAKKCLLLK
ncbi:MAG: T9SS type A sorting domain-containing protein, partial [Candidatus Cloacimonetes bacterium]|nr:T9SS type A sorting domain-containing protein [Candidatus Cloacimonadota bacterium]